MKVVVFILLCVFTFSGCKEEITYTKSINSDTPIGVIDFIWEDTNRSDNYYGGTRIVNTRVWYPVDSVNDSLHASYYLYLKEAFPELNHWNEDEYVKANEVESNTFYDSELSSEKPQFPLIILSPSLGGNLSHYFWYAEKLVENGYIVMGVNHLHESEFIIASDGRIYPSNHSFHDSLKTLTIPEQITADEYRKEKGIRQIVLGEDLIFSLDKLLCEPFFQNRIDESKIGAMGHSIGGAAAIYTALLDPRIKAVIDLDGTPPTEALEHGIDTPFMFLEDLTDYENHRGYKILHERRNAFCELNRGESWRVLIDDSHHNSYLDTNYHFANSNSDKKKAEEFLTLTSDYIENFFSHYLNGKNLELITQKPENIEVFHFPNTQ